MADSFLEIYFAAKGLTAMSGIIFVSSRHFEHAAMMCLCFSPKLTGICEAIEKLIHYQVELSEKLNHFLDIHNKVGWVIPHHKLDRHHGNNRVFDQSIEDFFLNPLFASIHLPCV